MEPLFVAKNVGAKVCVYEKYITVKQSLLANDVMIPFKQIASVETGFLGLSINTKDGKTHKVSIKADDKKLYKK